jgi:CRISPR-associated endonuclease/helicase Cas3
MVQKILAHTGNSADGSDGQLLVDHLTQVGSLAKEFAAFTPLENIAEVTGLLHDLGKFSVQFQARLRGSKESVNHSTAGAQEAIKRYGHLGKIIAFVIAGHHAGLANGIDEGTERRPLADRLKETVPPLQTGWEEAITLPSTLEEPTNFLLRKDFEGFQISFLIRMLYSCLVDADFIDTDNFYRSLKGEKGRSSDETSLTVLKNAFNQHLKSIQENQKSSNEVHHVRSVILEASRNNATLSPGLFSLTVPTGGGKTLTSMGFALDHALLYGMRRVIYVIPFTSIIEQNAQVFRESFGEFGDNSVLEHHSAFMEKGTPNKDSRDKLKIASENWQMPVVVTTAVQFFESLFADRSSACRKLHNIAGSVIILDEAQSLPLSLLRPIMASIDELARNYRCSIVLCTATQPALSKEQHGFYNGFENVREIAYHRETIPNSDFLFQKLKRVSVKHIGVQSDEDLLRHLSKHEQILTIVNNRRHARALFDSAAELSGIRHLTTLMCAKHRTKVLSEIRDDLKLGKPCRVISTSLIEAGVDVSFPTVYRAEAGLDSIAQAAGRCNRHGEKQSEDSHVLIFQAPDWPAPPELAQLSEHMAEVVRNHQGDLLSPDALSFYFKLTYKAKGMELDEKKILERLQAHIKHLDFPFQNTALDFRMIERHMTPVIIPYDKFAIAQLRDLRFSENSGAIARKLQPYIVQVPDEALESLRRVGAIALVQPDKFGNQFWELKNESMYIYPEESGLRLNDPSFIKAEHLVF